MNIRCEYSWTAFFIHETMTKFVFRNEERAIALNIRPISRHFPRPIRRHMLGAKTRCLSRSTALVHWNGLAAVQTATNAQLSIVWWTRLWAHNDELAKSLMIWGRDKAHWICSGRIKWQFDFYLLCIHSGKFNGDSGGRKLHLIIASILMWIRAYFSRLKGVNMQDYGISWNVSRTKQRFADSKRHEISGRLGRIETTW